MKKMTSLIDAERLTMRQVAKRLNVHLGTAWRWTLYGVAKRKLRSVKIGGRRQVLLSDLEEFVAGVNAEFNVAVRTPSAKRRAEIAELQLDRLGIAAREDKRVRKRS